MGSSHVFYFVSLILCQLVDTRKEHMMAICYLIGAGTFVERGLYPKEGDCVIAADDGYTMLRTAGITPDLLVGDFDSLASIPEDIPRKTFSPEKDETDMAIALEEGMARGYRTFHIYGACGGRSDHTFANLQLLGGASKRGCNGKLICPEGDIYAVTNGTLHLPAIRKGAIVSVFCHGEQAVGVTLQGLKYPLKDATLLADRPIGVSNEAVGGDVTVSVDNGTLLVFVMM